MALSANRTDFQPSQDEKGIRLAPEIINADIVYHGALLSADTDTGAAKPFDGTETDKLYGWHVGEQTTGDTSASPPPRAQIISGPFTWHACPVTGLAGTVADQGKRVWATDDGTYTVIDPGSIGAEVGMVEYYINSTTADVIMHNVLGHVDSLSALPTPTPSPSPTPTPTPTP